MVLLDVTPDQSLMDEGVAREVINRIQKLRKKVCQIKNKLLFWNFAQVLVVGEDGRGKQYKWKSISNQLMNSNQLMKISCNP